jgi:hypothetical protein
MFRHPKVSAVRNALLQPFTVTVWMCALGTWLLVLLTLRISAWLESTYDSDESTVESSWSATMLATVGAVSEQGTLVSTAIHGPVQQHTSSEDRSSATALSTLLVQQTPSQTSWSYILIKYNSSPHEGTWVDRRYGSYSFSTSVLHGDERSASRPSRALAPGKGPPVPIVQEAGWAPDTEATGKILSTLPGIEPRSPGRPARIQTLY